MKQLRYIRQLGLVSALLLGFASQGVALAATETTSPAAARAAVRVAVQAPVRAAAHNTYTVLVGDENIARAVDIEAFFPNTLHVHVGDTVLWRQNTNEIHTVSFLAGAAAPDLIVPAPAGQPSPLMLNPQVAFPAVPAKGQYDGSAYANSGIMGRAPGQMPSFKLTFTKAGAYTYICLVHGMEMSGTVMVEDASVTVPSAAQVMAEGRKQMAQAMAQVPAVIKEAESQIQVPTHNSDGTTTYHVMMGYMKGQIDLMRFFPSKYQVHPGDTVEWSLGKANDAPHTVTFLNGAASPPLVMTVPVTQGPPLLLLSPAVLMPQNAGKPLTRHGIFSSGLLNPDGPGPKAFSLKIGDIIGRINYECILHAASGMRGYLNVTPIDDDDRTDVAAFAEP